VSQCAVCLPTQKSLFNSLLSVSTNNVLYSDTYFYWKLRHYVTFPWKKKTEVAGIKLYDEIATTSQH